MPKATRQGNTDHYVQGLAPKQGNKIIVYRFQGVSQVSIEKEVV